MSTLREFQTAMAGYLTATPGPNVPEALRKLLLPGESRADRRFTIYKNNVYARLVDALRDTFPAVERLVGEEFFRFAAVEYIAKTSPKIATLLTYGAEFPGFLAALPPTAGIPYLADVARLEFAYLEAYHARDASPLGRAAAIVGGDDVRLPLHPSARLMTSPFQVSRIWELNRNEASFDNVTLPQLREYLLVIRPAREVEVRRLHLGAYAMLLAFDGGASRAEARREAEWADPDFDFQTHFATLADTGTFVGTSGKDRPL
ncbi:MAG: putative DNA-binding domain-containing protein [Alphaproteobacteria bacterium]|nr:putative DNA-binding domain-containing protein [Alphaproteobacteria bacterium]